MAEGPITRFMCVLKPCGLFLHAFSQLAFFDLQARIFQIQYFVPRHKFALASLATIIIHAFALNGQRGELLFACSSHIRGALFIGTSNTITRAHHHCHHQHHYHHHYQYYKDRERESHSHQKKNKVYGSEGDPFDRLQHDDNAQLFFRKTDSETFRGGPQNDSEDRLYADLLYRLLCLPMLT